MQWDWIKLLTKQQSRDAARPMRRHRVLLHLERSEDRLAPVVGAVNPDDAPLTLPGQGYDGVVRV